MNGIEVDVLLAETYRWQDASGAVFWFNVAAMREAGRGREPLVALVSVDEAELIAVANDISREWATKMSRERLREPILVWEREDGTHVIVDGSHRLWRNAILRRPQLMWAFQTAEIGPFLMPNAADLEAVGAAQMSRHHDATMAQLQKRGRL